MYIFTVNNFLRGDNEIMKRRIRITGLMKREDGRMEVQLPNGQWLLTSRVESYFCSGGYILVETQNTIYYRTQENRQIYEVESFLFRNDGQQGYILVTLAHNEGSLWVPVTDVTAAKNDLSEELAEIETSTAIFRRVCYRVA